MTLEQQDVERIARAALRELGVSGDPTVSPGVQPGDWRIDIKGGSEGPPTLKIRAGAGSTAQWVRQQIVEQLTQ